MAGHFPLPTNEGLHVRDALLPLTCELMLPPDSGKYKYKYYVFLLFLLFMCLFKKKGA
jgi:hypothetical protein